MGVRFGWRKKGGISGSAVCSSLPTIPVGFMPHGFLRPAGCFFFSFWLGVFEERSRSFGLRFKIICPIAICPKVRIQIWQIGESVGRHSKREGMDSRSYFFALRAGEMMYIGEGI